MRVLRNGAPTFHPGDDEVVGMIIVDEKDSVMTVTEKGYGKRTPVADYRKTNRGGSGIINIKVTDKNGPVVALKGVYRDGDVLLITRNGIIIRSDVGKISVIGRNTQGVRLISLEDGDSVIDVAMCEKEENGQNGAEEKGPEESGAQQATAEDGGTAGTEKTGESEEKGRGPEEEIKT